MIAEEDLLLPAYQKLYAALANLERFNKGQDLYDNITCIDGFLSEFRNVTFVLQKSLAHTDYLSTYEVLRDKYLKNAQCSWLLKKRNEVLKEKPFALEKLFILSVYLPHTAGIFCSECYTIEDEVDYASLIEEIERATSVSFKVSLKLSTLNIFSFNSTIGFIISGLIKSILSSMLLIVFKAFKIRLLSAFSKFVCFPVTIILLLSSNAIDGTFSFLNFSSAL